jgi:hypothetical protein
MEGSMRWHFPATLRWCAFLAALLACSEGMLASAWGQGLGNPTVRDSNVGYIDPAIPGDFLRFRFDHASDNPRPSRAEFFYPKTGPFNPGPPNTDTRADFQDLLGTVELLLLPGLSGFVELPVRFVDLQANPNASGLADMNAGVKYAFVNREDFVSSLQLRTWIPTGDSFRGLGTNHVSLEPALLLWTQLDRWNFEGEVRYWIPLGGTDFAGSILRTGAGCSYHLFQTQRVQVLPVGEVITWVVLGGKEAIPLSATDVRVESAAGDTIVNAKLGIRFKYANWGDLYTGYGRALTGDRWYANTFRVEWRLMF